MSDEDSFDDLPPPPSRASFSETIPADYRIESEIGRGGMGVVFRARHRKLDRVVALKLILSGAFADRGERERFLAEARATARLQHPNIVQIFEVGDEGGTPFMALECVEGKSLAQTLSASPLPPTEAAALVETLARAIDYAHSRGVVHRDVKPANILLGSDGPKLVDFGVSKVIDSSTRQQQSAFAGTPSYMAPEQATGGPIGPLADVYALGAVLYESLTGRPPFKAASVAETVKNIVEKSPVPPTELQPGVPADLNTICIKCLEKEPTRRYPSAAALAEDLQRFGAGLPILARPVGRRERTWRWMRRNPGDAALIGGLVGAIVAGVAGLLWESHRTGVQRDRAEKAAIEVGRERTEALRAQKAAEERGHELQRAIDNTAFLIGAVDLDQLFHFRALKVDPALLLPALAANRKFLEEFGADPEREPEVVAAWYRVAILTRMTASRAEALAVGRQALERQQKFVAANPDAAQYKRDLAAAYHNVGFLYHTTEKPREALEQLAQARRIREEFVEAQPDNLDYVSELAGCLNDIGLASHASALKSNDPAMHATAEQALAAARDRQRTVVRRAPHVPRYRQLLANHLFNYGRVQALLGGAREAVAAAEELVELLPSDGAAPIRAARILALVAARGGPVAQRAGDRATALLQDALAGAYDRDALVAGLFDFRALDKRPDFARVLARAAAQLGDVRSSADRQ